ncbi:hypothetical protein MARINON1_51754 [Marinobacter salarius]|nr:hypothetical protein MBHK15_110989 [Marinobacter salarius]VXB97308.1 hypothetical protein MARINON1_51754 [Marinobacter salarius]
MPSLASAMPYNRSRWYWMLLACMQRGRPNGVLLRMPKRHSNGLIRSGLQKSLSKSPVDFWPGEACAVIAKKRDPKAMVRLAVLIFIVILQSWEFVVRSACGGLSARGGLNGC